MNKYFTKEYIKECDCEEIQGLRQAFKKGDWYFEKGQNSNVNYYDCNRFITGEGKFMDLWLPTGDQLDEEIVKLVDNDSFYRYYFDTRALFSLSFHIQHIGSHNNIISPPTYIDIRSSNPLIAKIRLLKELLKKVGVASK